MAERPNIPEKVKREVRQACGFGCCICGEIATDYEHIVPYAEVRIHESSNLALLCSAHHSEVTRGRLSKAVVLNARKSPVGLRHKNPKYFLSLTAQNSLKIGGNMFHLGDRQIWSPLEVFGDCPMTIEIISGIPVVTAQFFDHQGKLSLFINQNVIEVIASKNWDVRLQGTNFEVWHGRSRKYLHLNINNSVLEVVVFRTVYKNYPASFCEDYSLLGYSERKENGKKKVGWHTCIGNSGFFSNGTKKSYVFMSVDYEPMRQAYPRPLAFITHDEHTVAKSYDRAFRLLFSRSAINEFMNNM